MAKEKDTAAVLSYVTGAVKSERHSSHEASFL